MQADLDRYHRQMLLPDFGEQGQRRLLESHALIVGVGALGCAIADLLARAGVGALTLIDRDVVEHTNLQRQTLFTEQDAAGGLPKAEAARRRLSAVNAQTRITPIIADFAPSNAEAITLRPPSGPLAPSTLPGILLDGTDNFETRYLLNDIAVKHGIPYAYGGVVGTQGMATTILPGSTPCLRCLFDEPPMPGTFPTCDTAGVFGPAVAIVAACQASDAIKILLGRPDLTARSLLDFNLWTNHRRRLDLGPITPRSDCPCCALRRFEFLDGARAADTVSLCGQNAVQITPASAGHPLDLDDLAGRLAPHGSFVRLGDMLIRGELSGSVRDSAGPLHLTIFADGRVIIRGTQRPELARSLYARYIGA